MLSHLASHLEDILEVDCQWKTKHTMEIKRRGLTGEIKIRGKHLYVNMQVGITLRMFKKNIEKSIREFIDHHIH